jgi:glycosyltransferase involved in cell wall biosynthesis
MKQKILIVTIDATLMGGVERSNSHLSRLFKSKGHDVVVISFYKSLENEHFDFNEINLVYLNERPIISGLASKFHMLLSFLRFFAYLRSLEGGYLVLSCFPRISLPLAVLSRSPNNVIACEHSSFEAHSKLIRSLRLFFYKRLRCVVTLTEHDRAIFSGAGVASFRIPNFTDFRRSFSPLDTSRRPFSCISAGRLHPHKGFDRLIEIARYLKNENIKFTIIGSGQEEEKIRRLITVYELQRSVTLLPASKSIHEFLEAADLFVMTSVTEAAPMIILEAFANSKPVIAYDCPVGPREIISDGINGYLVKNGDVLSFVDKIRYVKSSPILYNKLAENAGIYSKCNSSENNYKLWLKAFE